MALCGLPIASGRPVAASSLRWQNDPFSLGVASGDPSPDGVVLWTRLAPDPLNGGGMAPVPVDVRWEVAGEESFRRVVKRGTARAEPAWGHSVHVEVNGLEPARWYWYRFRVGSDVSPIGRTRTLPARARMVERMRFAFASCQHYETGLYTAYTHLTNEDLELCFFLGDYTYEGPGRVDQVRTHAGPELMTLEHYRNRLAQYKTDPRLQAAHAAFPWVMTWDDHEVDNNYANDRQEGGAPPEEFLLRRAAAYQAYYEHQPLRRTAMPKGPDARMYRSMDFGMLGSFFMLDTRQYRTPQPCDAITTAPCAGTDDPKGTITGDRQEQWLLNGLDRAGARWHVIPQQVMMARVNQGSSASERYSMDQWPGYEAERQRFLSFLGTRKPSNPVVLTGDIHSNWVNHLQVNEKDERAPVVAVELVGTSISSGGDGSLGETRLASLRSRNPFVQYYNNLRGYVSCEVTPAAFRAKYQCVDYVSKPGAPLTTRATVIVENGVPGVRRDG